MTLDVWRSIVHRLIEPAALSVGLLDVSYPRSCYFTCTLGASSGSTLGIGLLLAATNLPVNTSINNDLISRYTSGILRK